MLTHLNMSPQKAVASRNKSSLLHIQMCNQHSIWT